MFYANVPYYRRAGASVLARALDFFVRVAVLCLAPTAYAIALTTTTTTLVASPNPAYANRNVTLTAMVTGASPTGTVTFMDGATSLGVASLSAGKATLTRSFSVSGSHSLTAAYSGNASNDPSVSSAVALTVSPQTATSATLSSDINPAFVGQYAKLTITVSGGVAPTGSVRVMEGAKVVASTSLSGGKGTVTASFSTAGTHVLTGEYLGDAPNAGSTSSPLSLVVNPKTVTTTTLSASPNPATETQAITFVATVTGSNPTGQVTFKDGSTTLGYANVSGGTATLTKGIAAAGDHTVTASYVGDAGNSSSVSAAQRVTVLPRKPTTVSFTIGTNPAYVGQAISFVVTVSGESPSGTVTLMDGNSSLATASLVGGQARFSRSFSTAGSHSMKVVYNGDGVNSVSTSVPQNLTVKAKNAAAVTLASSPNPSVINQSVNLTALVTGDTPSGTVTFKDGNSTLGSATISAGRAVLAKGFTTTGSHSLTAVYAGDVANSTATSSPVSQVVTLPPTTTVLSTSANPAEAGQALTLVASVTGVTPSGSVTFTDGSTTLGVVNLVNGKATLATRLSAVGVHRLVATYGGDTRNAQSTSAALNQNVGRRTTAISLAGNPNPATPGQAITLIATLSATSPTGTITFRDGAAVIATVPVTGAGATASTSFAVPSVRTITAAYDGDSLNSPSSSQSLELLISSDSGAAPGQAMTWNFEYNAKGRETKMIDPNDGVTERTYDLHDQVARVTQPAPVSGQPRPTIGMNYDGRGALVQVTDPRNLKTTYVVDGLGNTSVQQSPDTGASTATYNELGQLATFTDARGKVSTYSYDVLNRLVRIDYSSGVPTIFTYDIGANAVGRLSGFSDESGSTTFAYDGFGHVVSKTQTSGSGPTSKTFNVGYGWGGSGPATSKLQSIAYPSGRTVTYDFDYTGRVGAIYVDGIPLVTNITYHGLGSPQTWQWGDATLYQRGFDAYGRIGSYPLGKLGGVGASAGALRTLSYDAAGRIVGYTHSTIPSLDQLFSYDGLDRLISAQSGTASYGYLWDANGNRTQSTVSGAVYTLSVSATSNRYTSVQSPGGGSPLTQAQSYDLAGNLTNDGNSTLAYSDRGRLNSAVRAGGTVSYLYNALDQRVFKSGPVAIISSGTSHYVYSEEGRLLGEYDATGAPLYEIVYLNEYPVGVLKAAGGLGYVYADHLGTPRVVARSSDHAIVWRWDSVEPFGRNVANANPNGFGVYTLNLRMPGQIYDAESGWFYNWHRDYIPDWGRYVQSDPIGLAGGINTYAYVGGNPLSYADPLGLKQKASSPHCKALQRKIDNLMKDLDDRWLDLQKGGLPERLASPTNEPLRSTMRGHRTLINDRDSVVRKWEKRYDDECEPDDKDEGNSCPECTAGAVVATVAGGYVVYRCVRMLPSLLPPLWWTIPANAAVP
ncbi:Ig-like domain repeat protein [Pelomonas sp. UHG3]|uniref:Ig-like domain repeat protein n=1 Tax=Roseateles hydrophilus TaxID=2975054 RepID=A0ACC6CG96_9BURK|nr:Ig-like domain repeat protein [Pelomonas sp. UHG3]MCY4747421.1 Ig-like domain repeat protein [Pelomonas sp. UHG3]